MNRERLKGHLDLLLLAVLAAGPAHGYAVISALRQRSEGTFDLPEGTVYPALHRLEQQGWIRAEWGPSENGRRAKFYALTEAGRAKFAEERAQWERLSAAIGVVLAKA